MRYHQGGSSKPEELRVRSASPPRCPTSLEKGALGQQRLAAPKGLLLAAPFPRDVASRVGAVFPCNSICSVTVGKGFSD